jgi:branched-chain amino acid transport system ATP-binding protein
MKSDVSKTPLLTLKNVCKRYRGVTAVDDVSMDVIPGEIVGLIGPNGAGKTTLVNLISGLEQVTSGSISFEGNNITKMPAHAVACNGIARTFQVVQPFAQMTVLENVMAGALYAGDCKTRRQAEEEARKHLEFIKLDKFANSPASELALANRKRLELAKSLAMKPRLLMLDEVNAGLNSSEISEALALIRSIAEQGVTIIIIEHLMRVISELAERIVVLHHGTLLHQGSPIEVLHDSRVVEAYLGSKFAKHWQDGINAK